MTKAYEELDSLLKNGQDLSSFFSEKRKYKKLFTEALENSNHLVITEMAKYLPVDVWFDKSLTWKKFNDIINNVIFGASKFRWCMTNADIRAYFTPEEKGSFVQIGLLLKDHKMAFCATQDGWKKDIFEEALEVELDRMASSHIKSMSKSPFNKEYFEWVQKEFFPFFNKEEHYQFLLGSFMLGVGKIRVLAEYKILADNDLLLSDADKEAIFKSDKELKECIVYLKESLEYEYWSNDFKEKFTRYILKPIPSRVPESINKEELKEFAINLKSSIDYTKISQALSEKEGISSNKKIKI